MKEKTEGCQVIAIRNKNFFLKKEKAAARSWHVCFCLDKSVTLDLW